VAGRLGQPVGVRATGQTRPARTFWWDRDPRTQAADLRAVIFDADSALADIERDGDVAAMAGLIDLVMSLFVAGIWVGVVSTRPREWVETLVRDLVGDGLVETIVTVDDLSDDDTGPECGAELYRLALWELGITHRNALAVAAPGPGIRAAVAAELPAVLVTTGYDGADPLRAVGCRQTHRRWWIAQQRAA
jgi:beta-phosphoglucomutase-like phosphatase (HAD superfamily)